LFPVSVILKDSPGIFRLPSDDKSAHCLLHGSILYLFLYGYFSRNLPGTFWHAPLKRIRKSKQREDNGYVLPAVIAYMFLQPASSFLFHMAIHACTMMNSDAMNKSQKQMNNIYLLMNVRL